MVDDQTQGRFEEMRERFDRLETLIGALTVGQTNLLAGLTRLRTELMARMDRLRDAASRDREDVRLISGAAQAAHKSALQLLEMTTVLHRYLTNAEQAIDDIRKPPEAA